MIRPKDREKIISDLKELISNKLLSDTKIGNGRPIHSIESINIPEINIDSENNDRNKIIVNDVHAFVRLHIEFIENSFSSKDVQIKNNKQIEFEYNEETDTFEIIESNVVFYSTSLW